MARFTLRRLAQSGGERQIPMFTVYVLQDKIGKYYKGVTGDMSRRFKEHRNRHTKTTKSMDELRVVYVETYGRFAEARARELYLKTTAGLGF